VELCRNFSEVLETRKWDFKKTTCISHVNNMHVNVPLCRNFILNSSGSHNLSHSQHRWTMKNMGAEKFLFASVMRLESRTYHEAYFQSGPAAAQWEFLTEAQLLAEALTTTTTTTTPPPRRWRIRKLITAYY
jgi:hypothetical protein